MGGNGSGFQGWRKDTVESCLSLSIFDLKRMRIVESNMDDEQRRSGVLEWTDANGSKLVTISFHVWSQVPMDCFFNMYYTVGPPGQEEPVEIHTTLESTVPHFGGRRWWFHCPILRCGRRVANLYLPPGELYFGCRHCHNLTYRSTQRWDKRYSAFIKDIKMLGR